MRRRMMHISQLSQTSEREKKKKTAADLISSVKMYFPSDSFIK